MQETEAKHVIYPSMNTDSKPSIFGAEHRT